MRRKLLARFASSAFRPATSSGIRSTPLTIEEVAAAPEKHAGAGFWAWLFGSDAMKNRVTLYKQALDRGGTVISVRVLDEEAFRVQAVLDSCGPIGIEAA